MDQFHFKKFICKKNIPNILTISRLLIVLVILIIVFIPSNSILYEFNWNGSITSISINFFVAGVLFLVACLSDFLDGALARKMNWESNFGKVWDPIADKILINSIYIAFAVINIVPWYLVILMIFRDTIIDGYRINIAAKGIIIKASFWGKLKTVSQMISIAVIFFIFNSKDQNQLINFLLIQNLFVFVAAFFSLNSGIIYIYEISKQNKKNKL